ncbi:GIY-YIG nuclease family protein [Sphingopyxis sp. JAI128]|uniref:GIY-YIG nuclease family protein n=1 Tax=Sphingopyxis sp. JAI128 TaxID=2723066 RepID=UPI00161291A9|nr:GIY-YIG nuclease family protein [Sphingopyxis sp. JAI128]MBB6424968.1 hypothetical protein [Sphingopyxis sp. JAI128]
MSEAVIWTDAMLAENFVKGVELGVNSYGDISRYENVYGPAEGFVYFAYIGANQPVYLKIGFSKYDPRKRLKNLQTGCPFPIKMLGFVFGRMAQEAELHDVLSEYRVQGEWFDYSDYVERVVRDQLDSEAI